MSHIKKLDVGGQVLMNVERLRTLIVEIALIINGLFHLLVQNQFVLSIIILRSNSDRSRSMRVSCSLSSVSVSYNPMASRSSDLAAFSQPSHKVSSNRPRGNCGAAACAACTAAAAKDVSSGLLAAFCHSRAACWATTVPVWASSPVVGLISMFSA